MACEKHEYYYLFWQTIDELFNTTPHQKILLKNIILVFNSPKKPEQARTSLNKPKCARMSPNEPKWARTSPSKPKQAQTSLNEPKGALIFLISNIIRT